MTRLVSHLSEVCRATGGYVLFGILSTGVALLIQSAIPMTVGLGGLAVVVGILVLLEDRSYWQRAISRAFPSQIPESLEESRLGHRADLNVGLHSLSEQLSAATLEQSERFSALESQYRDLTIQLTSLRIELQAARVEITELRNELDASANAKADFLDSVRRDWYRPTSGPSSKDPTERGQVADGDVDIVATYDAIAGDFDIQPLRRYPSKPPDYAAFLERLIASPGARQWESVRGHSWMSPAVHNPFYQVFPVKGGRVLIFFGWDASWSQDIMRFSKGPIDIPRATQLAMLETWLSRKPKP